MPTLTLPIPEGRFWAKVRKQSVDIGTALNTSFRAIEDANPRLKGVFKDVDASVAVMEPSGTSTRPIAVRRQW